MQTQRILVVEDDRLQAADIEHKLRKLGYEVCATAPSAEQALDHLQRMHCDLVLMDIVLAGPMDGIAAARIIQDRHELPVVFLSSHSEPEILKRAVDAAPFGFVLKPAETLRLRSTLEMAISKHATEVALRRSETLYRTLFQRAHDAIVMIENGLITDVNPRTLEIFGCTREQAVGHAASEFAPATQPDGRPSSEAAQGYLRAAMAGQPQAFVWRGLRGKTPIDCEVSLSRIEVMDRELVLAIVRDVSAAQRHQKITQTLYRISSAVSTTTDLAELLASIQKALGLVLDTDNFAVGLVDSPQGMLHFPYQTSTRGSSMADRPLDLEPPCLATLVARSGNPAHLRAEQIQTMVNAGALQLDHDLPAVWLGVPLRFAGEVVGVMSVQHDEDPERYTQEDLELLAAVSEQVALAAQRKRYEEALLVSEEKYRSIFDNSMDGIFQADVHGRFLAVNPAMASMLGAEDLQELLSAGWNLFDFLAEPGQDERLTGQLTRDKALRNLELTLRDSHGITRWTSLNAHLREDPETGDRLIEGVLRDISERKAAEGELSAAHQRLLDIIEFLPDPTFVIDAQGKVTHWNRAMEDMTGVAKHEIIGRGDNSHALPFYGRRRPLLIDLVGPGQLVISDDYEIIERRGSTLISEVFASALYGGRGAHLWCAASPLLDAAGRKVGAIESVRDITRRHRAEQELRQARDEMEERVRERTRELEEANLRLREIDQLKSSLLSAASHELRTPLTSILGFTKLIRKDVKRLSAKDKPPRAEQTAEPRQAGRILKNLDIIEFEGERLTRLINDVLDLNKIESGHVEWHDQLVDLPPLMEHAIAAVTPEFETKPQVSLQLRVPYDLPRILADPDRIEQVLINLLSNAAKFTRQGRVQLSGEIPRPGWVRLRVADTGVGIPLEDQERIFEKFHQARRGNTMEKHPIGTGLGLTICREIVEYYGGAIRVSSEVGSGSVFTVDLPAAATTP